MTGNKHGSIVESFATSDIVTINPLSTAATPPADVDVAPYVVGTSPFAFPLLSPISGNILPRFDITDVPRILGIGVFCNLADGLVPIDPWDTTSNFGLNISLTWGVYDIAGAPVVSLNTHVFRVNALNVIFDQDLYLQPYASGIVVGNVNYNHTCLTIDAASTVQAKYSTISIDPGYAAKRFSMWAQLIIEHSKPMLATGP